MSSLKTLIRKMNSIPIKTPITNSIYREILEIYQGNDYKNEIDKMIPNNSDIRIIEDNNYILSINLLKKNNKIKIYNYSHINLICGNICCSNNNHNFVLKNGTISLPNNYTLIGKDDKDSVFISIYSKSKWENMHLL